MTIRQKKQWSQAASVRGEIPDVTTISIALRIEFVRQLPSASLSPSGTNNSVMTTIVPSTP